MRLEKKRRTIKLMKKRGRMWGSITFFLAVVLLAGCGQREQKSVIGPREETAAEASEEMGEDPVTNGLESGRREACLSVTDTDCLKAQVEVPDCSGLGLALCERIVRLHGGKLHIQSQEGEGTSVTVEFPEDGLC